MPLKEEIEAQGQWLFRWRSYLPLLVLPLVFAGMVGVRASGQSLPGPAWWLFCLAVSLVGLGVRFHIAGHVPKQTSGRNTVRQMAAELNTTGFYSVVRHPLYLGNLLLWLGLALTPGVWWVALLVLLVFWVYYERIMVAEEEYLRRRFGEPYEQWATETPAILPRWSRWRRPSLPFSLRTAIRREYSSLYGLLATFLVLWFVAEWLRYGSIALDGPRVLALSVAAGVYLGLVLLKKKTRVLRVEGR